MHKVVASELCNAEQAFQEWRDTRERFKELETDTSKLKEENTALKRCNHHLFRATNGLVRYLYHHFENLFSKFEAYTPGEANKHRYLHCLRDILRSYMPDRSIGYEHIMIIDRLLIFFDLSLLSATFNNITDQASTLINAYYQLKKMVVDILEINPNDKEHYFYCFYSVIDNAINELARNTSLLHEATQP